MRLIRQHKLRSAVIALVLLFGSATDAHADAGSNGPGDQQARTQAQLQARTSAPAPTTPTDQPTTPAPAPTTPTPAPTTPTDQPAGPTSAATGSTQTAPPAPVDSAAVQAATTQAAHEFQAGSSPADQGSGPAASTGTNQTIVQLQISGCTAHCQGTTQTQVAQQANTTIQVLGGGPQAAAAGLGSGGDGSQITGSVTQIQLGCLDHCFGITTTSAAVSGGIEQTIAQLLSILASVPSRQAALAASQQGVVDQTSYQWQEGATSQTQVAVQTKITVQIVDLASRIAAALAPSDPNANAATSQTEQRIWQLQAGCLVFCSQTQQSQQAQQSNTIVQALSPSAGQPTGIPGAVTSVGRQLIYQLQIGCLFWCYDATEQQVASQTSTTQQVLGSSPPPGSGPPPAAGAPAPAGAPIDGQQPPVPGGQPTAPTRAPQTAPTSAPNTPPPDGPQQALPAAPASVAPVGGGSRVTSSGVSTPPAGGLRGPAPSPGSAHPAPWGLTGPRPLQLPGPEEPPPSARLETVSQTASSASALATSAIVATPPARLTTGQRVTTATTGLAEELRRFERRHAHAVWLAGLPSRPARGPSVVSAHHPIDGFGMDAGLAGALVCVTFLVLLLAMRHLVQSRK